MNTNLWKSGALALALGSVLALPSLVQAQPRYRNGAGQYRRNQRLNNRVYNNSYNSNRTVFTGVVTRRRSNTQFDVRIGDRTYNVYTSYAVPRGLDRDDRVRVTGQRVGNNDIRYANVVSVRNR